MDAADPAARPALLASGRSLPLIHVEPWDGTVPSGATSPPDLPVIRKLRNGAGRPVTITDLSAADPERGRSDARLHIGVVTPTGARLQATLPNDPLRGPRQGGADLHRGLPGADAGAALRLGHPRPSRRR
jgi:hypothetical protein